ncbi:glycosyltransferase family 4 protein [bacterium]|nr:glycosyltransferase family 4 protein [bacterium]
MSDCKTKKLKIVFISDGYPTDYHPMNNVYLHRAIKNLAQFVQASVVHLRAWKPGRAMLESRQWEGIPVLSMAIPQLPLRSSLHLNIRLLAKLGYPLANQTLTEADLLHSTGIYPAGYITSHWSQLLKKPHVTHAVGSDVNMFLPKARWLRRERSWLDEINGVACVSQAIKSKVMLLDNNLPNVRVIYRGIDTDQFSPQGPAEGPQARQPATRFFYLGGFQTWNKKRFDVYNVKGGHVLLEAWSRVEAQLGESSLVISGHGIHPDRLKSWIGSLKRPEAVFFLPMITPVLVPNFLRACDIVVIPSLSEGLPNLAYEAQACGRPVLASDAGGIPEAIVHGDTGLLVPKGDSKALADAMLWFHLHQKAVARMGANARRHVRDHFSLQRAALEMLSLFDAAIQHHHSSS